MTNPFPGYNWTLEDMEVDYDPVLILSYKEYLKKATKWWPPSVLNNLEQMLEERDIKFFIDDDLLLLAIQIMHAPWLTYEIKKYASESGKYHRKKAHAKIVKLLKHMKVDKLIAGD